MNSNIAISRWLITIMIFIGIIIIIGAITRLTNSGLSITEWELFNGILPPLNDITWSYYFDQYKLFDSGYWTL